LNQFYNKALLDRLSNLSIINLLSKNEVNLHLLIDNNSIQRTNNFDFLRLVFAYFVIISHCYPICGEHNCDWLCELSKKQIWFSFIGLKGFFVISGYLIFKSLSRSDSLKTYFLKRFYRIFPAFVTVLLITVLLLSIVYNNDTTSYFYQTSVWTYVPINLSLVFYQLNIINLFETNPYPYIVNGSLWTIPYEVLFYCLLPLFKLTNENKTKLISLMIFTILIFSSFYVTTSLKNMTLGSYQVNHLIDLMAYFLSGILINLFKLETHLSNNKWILIFILLIVFSIYFHLFDYIKFIAFPIVIILIGNKSLPIINQVYKRIGDISFGLYLYAFPIQQTLYYYFKLKPMPLFIYSALITTVFAILSWHIIEKRFINKIKTKKLQA